MERLIESKHNIFLTGPPRVGKTTVVLRVIEELKRRGVKVGGMISQEIRERGIRVGFKIVDLNSGREGILAHVNRKKGPRVGKYRVCLEDLENLGARAILNACKAADLIVIDEVGPMELYSEAFKRAVLEALSGNKTVLGTIHYRARTSFTEAIRRRENVKIIEVTYGNRERLPKAIVEEILKRLFE